MASYWTEEHIGDTINPWLDASPDPKVHTGGDWFRLLLTASVGGRAVHGANTSPTCEVLCKATKECQANNNYGVLVYDDAVSIPPILGDELSDQFYVGKPYRGNITASGSILAYESGLWEPSVRKRARSSALLAAGLVVHGKTTADACRLVSKITGEPLDVQAVDNAIVPASHLKREMVLVAKASHRVFSQGTLQQAITWYDDKLITRMGARNMAFDWGRITALARYIAEANIQNCHSFRTLANGRGIPFTVVRNSWAYVSDADYQLPNSTFARVPPIDLRRYGIPSLIGTFIGHEQDIMIALHRGSKYASFIPETEAFRAYMKLHSDARRRRGKKQITQVPYYSEAQEVNIEEHTLDERTLLGLLETGSVVRDSFTMAVASRRKADCVLDQLLTEIASLDLDSGDNLQKIDEATLQVFDTTTWLLARSIAESTLKEREPNDVTDRSFVLDKITSRLADMKADILGFRSHIETKLYASTVQLVKVRPRTVAIARRSADCTSFVTYSQRSLASAQLRATALAISNLGNEEDGILKVLRTEVADKYDEWYLKVVEETNEKARTNMAFFAYIHAFLVDITASLCYQRESGYIEGTLPRRSYVYQGLLRTAPDYHFTPPRLQRTVYSHANHIADELDRAGVVPYSVKDAVEEVMKIADKVVGDLMLGKAWQPEQDEWFEERIRWVPLGSPGYDDAALREEENRAKALAWMNALDAGIIRSFSVGYEGCLNTYPNHELANQIARANGYPNLRAAYDVLGNDADYDETNEFVSKGRTEIALAKRFEEEEAGESSKAAGKKRKYDAVI